MTKDNIWEEFYKATPLEKIPWQRTQADYFRHLVDDGRVSARTALDLGCSTGMKSVYLATRGFEKVVGIDVSETAIEHAKENAKRAGAENNIEFIVGDIADLSVLGDQKLDFILDWAALHCLPRENHKKYVQEILKHSKPKTMFLLRCFSSPDPRKQKMLKGKTGLDASIVLFQKQDILDLFSQHFKVIEQKVSKPQRNDDLFFLEFLMIRK